MEITQERVRDLFDYDNGVLRYRHNDQDKAILSGDIAGKQHPHGYVVVRVDGKSYGVHRIVFLMHHGYLPEFVDHIDRCKSNNSIENLRAANRFENGWNRSKNSNNTSGYKGVTWDKRKRKWRATIGSSGGYIFLGLHDTAESAHTAYMEAAKKHHKEFSCAE